MKAAVRQLDSNKNAPGYLRGIKVLLQLNLRMILFQISTLSFVRSVHFEQQTHVGGLSTISITTMYFK